MEATEDRISFEAFKKAYFKQLRSPQCFPSCIGDICGGWTQETFKQVLVKLTKNGKSPIQLWFSSTEEMEPISKKPATKDIFVLFDTKNLGRIDTMDLISILQLSSASKLDISLDSMMKIYGFVQRVFTKDEFHFYLDSLLSGIICTGIVKEFRGKRVSEKDIEALVSEIFEDNEEVLERQTFTHKLIEHPELGELFKYFQEVYVESSKYCKLKAMEIIQIQQMVRILVYEIVKNAALEGEENLQK